MEPRRLVLPFQTPRLSLFELEPKPPEICHFSLLLTGFLRTLAVLSGAAKKYEKHRALIREFLPCTLNLSVEFRLGYDALSDCECFQFAKWIERLVLAAK